MAKVNLPPLKPPDKWLADLDISKDVQELYFVIYQLYQRSGGGSDGNESLQIQIDINSGKITALDVRLTIAEGEIDVLQERLYKLYSLTADRVTESSEIIEANGFNVTLNSTPIDGETVDVKIGKKRNMYIDGGGKTIDGSLRLRGFRVNQSVTMVYFESGDKWLIRG